VEKISARNTKSFIFKSLKSNRNFEVQKDIKEVKAHNFMRKNFLTRFFRNLRQNTLKSNNKKKNIYEIITYKQNIEKLKVMESLKNYTFSHRKKKQLKNYKALKKWGKNASNKAFFALVAYKN